MAFITSGTVGLNLTTVDSTQRVELGKRVTATDGQQYVYVKAAEAITQYMFVAIDEDFNASKVTKALADAGYEIGVAQTAFASADYGFVATKGSNLTGRVLGSCVADVALYTSGTAGVLDDSSTSQTKIDGVVLVATNTTATAANLEILATWPTSDAI